MTRIEPDWFNTIESSGIFESSKNKPEPQAKAYILSTNYEFLKLSSVCASSYVNNKQLFPFF